MYVALIFVFFLISRFCNFYLSWQWRCRTLHKMWRGKAKPSNLCFFLFFCIVQIVFVCFFVLFLKIVYSYLLNCIVPLMSMKFPVKHTEDKSFYLSAKIFFGGEEKNKNKQKNKSEKNLSSQSVCFSDLHQNWLVQDGVPLLCYGDFIVWCSTFSN